MLVIGLVTGLFVLEYYTRGFSSVIDRGLSRTVSGHLFYQIEGLKAFLNNPILGVGTGALFKTMMGLKQDIQMSSIHNGFLLLAAEGGILVAFPFAIFLISCIRSISRGMRHIIRLEREDKSGSLKSEKIVLASSLLCFVVFVLSSILYEDIQSVLLIWIILGFSYGLSERLIK